jgi:hypothetical protein
MTYELTYNEQGLLAEESYHHKTSYNSKTTYTYDKDGNLLSKKQKAVMV